MFKATLTVPGNAPVTLVFPNRDARFAFMDCVHNPMRQHGASVAIPTTSLNGIRIPEGLIEILRNHYRSNGDKIAAIKMLRELTGSGLKEAKDFCEEYLFV